MEYILKKGVTDYINTEVNMMNCPKCYAKNTRVIRTGNGFDIIVRKRYCPQCNNSFHTIEKLLADDVVANDLINMYKSNIANKTVN